MYWHRNLLVEICNDPPEMVLFIVLIELAMEGCKKNPVQTWKDPIKNRSV